MSGFKSVDTITDDFPNDGKAANCSRLDDDKQHHSRTLLIDNYDSYSNILAHVIAECQDNSSLPLTVRNDAISVSDIRFLVKEHLIDRIVISPGPGTPSSGICDSGVVDALLNAKDELVRGVPIFGVCFGFQAIAFRYGWDVVRARHPKHGEVSEVTVKEEEDKEESRRGGLLFKGVPRVFKATRYHSLEALFPGKRKEAEKEVRGEEELVALAWADVVESEKENGGGGGGGEEGGTVMALRHKVYPQYGVQFHPESICTEPHGKTIVKNFMDIADAYWKEKRGEMEEEEEGNETTTTISEERKTVLMKLVNASRETQDKKSSNKSSNKKQKKSAYRLHAREVSLLDSPTRSEDVFRTLFSDKKNAFWLDSATADGSSGTNDSNGDNDTPRGRFSVMGCQGGPLWRRVEARMNGKLVVMNNQDEIVKIYHHGGNGSILEYMDEELKRFNVSEENFATCIVDEVNAVKDGESVKGLPEALLFACGFVGSLSYETREECDSPIFFANDSSSNSNTMVKAALYFVDQAVVVDHEKKMVYAMTLTEDGPETEDLFEALEWLATTTLDINRSLLNKVKHVADEMPKKTVVTQNCTQLAESIGFKWRDDKEEYMEKIKTSQERILDGHTYEVCLTNALTRRDVGAYKQTRHLYRELYYALRERNPAPYAAFFDFSNGAGEEKAHFSDMYVCCASPERFLRCDQNGNLEAKPIKGTIARVEPLGCAEDVKAARDLQTSVKDNAENLMIVDLLRNDLSLACEVGTVKVPGLLKIESYRTVHQLVSTVVGTLPSTSSGESHADGNDDDNKNNKRISPMRAFQFAFPPGSMTGAPKYRTTQIIHELENEEPREMYSGSVGFWSCRNKAFDANVVIRSVTYKDGEMKIGAGGAITRLSDPLEEWGEVELKARRIVETVAEVERKLERERD